MSNLNLNKVILAGRCCAKPELKTTPSGLSVTSFSVAVNRKAKAGEQAQADFFNVTAWRATAEFVTRYFDKGSSICIVGTLQNRSWTDQSGQKRTVTEIIADEVNFVDSRSDASQSVPQNQGGTYVPDAYKKPETAPTFEELNEDEDALPF